MSGLLACEDGACKDGGGGTATSRIQTTISFFLALFLLGRACAHNEVTLYA
jgi:hypothetical protein